MDKEAAQRVIELQERTWGRDLSIPACAAISRAFDTLDVVGDGRLDIVDVQFAFYCMHLFPSFEQVKELLAKACRDLAEIQGTPFNDEAEDLYLDKGAYGFCSC